MLDFDFVCRRTEPSVAAMVYPFTGDHKQKFYWGHKEILISGELTFCCNISEYFVVVVFIITFSFFLPSVYKKMEDAMTKHRDADVLVNFASLRSAYESTIETMNYPQVLVLIY